MEGAYVSSTAGIKTTKLFPKPSPKPSPLITNQLANQPNTIKRSSLSYIYNPSLSYIYNSSLHISKITIMARNELGPQPDFNQTSEACTSISDGFHVLATQLPRLVNVDYNRQQEQIIRILQNLERSVAEIKQILQQHDRRFTDIDNRLIQLGNSQRHFSDPTATLVALRNPQIGEAVANCPTTVAQINRLTGAQATSILQILGVPVPNTLASKRDAVRTQFFH